MGKIFLSFLKIVLDLHIDSLKKGILGFDYLMNRWNKNKFKTFFLTVELLEEKSNLFLFYFTIFFSFLQNSLLIYIDEVSPDIIKTKKSELRLYCDLLMQQVHSVKSVAQAGDPVDIEVCTHVYMYGVSIFVDHKWCGSLTIFEIPSLFIIPQSTVYCKTF